MDCETPVILAMVAVGAIAITFEFLIPFSETEALRESQSKFVSVF